MYFFKKLPTNTSGQTEYQNDYEKTLIQIRSNQLLRWELLEPTKIIIKTISQLFFIDNKRLQTHKSYVNIEPNTKKQCVKQL